MTSLDATGSHTQTGARAVLTGKRGFGRSVATTAVLNVVGTTTAGVAGVIIARALGPAGRGGYAAVMVWFGVLLAVGQLGQTAATTYFVARDPARRADYLATSRNLMIGTGTIALIAGIFLAPVLAAGNLALIPAYRLMFATCLASFVGASYTFALLATRIAWWNLVAVSQALAFVSVIIILYLGDWLTLMTVLVTLAITLVAQTTLAYALCRRQSLTGGRADMALARPMTRYGLSQLAATAPLIITSRLDQLALAFAAAPEAFGHYAVAASLTGLALPVVSAIGSAAFPRLASQELSTTSKDRLQNWSIMSSAAAATALMVALSAAAPWLIPLVFGPDFRAAVPIIWLLAPGGVFLACGQVCGDLLRGHGRPIAVARAQGISAITMAVLLMALFPHLGVAGAAIASIAAAATALVLMFISLRKVSGPGTPRENSDAQTEAYLP